MSLDDHRYRISGLSVDSAIPLPGLIEEEGSGPADVCIAPGPVPERLDAATAAGPTWEIAGEDFLLRIPGVARFLVTAGRNITVEPEMDADEGDIPAFLIGTVLGILQHQRGRIVMHAGAVAVNGRAVLFCGSSGAGKSTLTAALGNDGYAFVADDVCTLSFEQGQPFVHPDGRSLKLWKQAVNALDLGARQGAAVRRRLEKYHVAPSAAASASLPLGAVYALNEATPSDRPGIAQPNLVDGALLLRRNAYRPRLVRAMNQKAEYFQAAATVARHAGIYTLTRPLDFRHMPEIIAWLNSHWAEIGLTDHGR